MGGEDDVDDDDELGLHDDEDDDLVDLTPTPCVGVVVVV